MVLLSECISYRLDSGQFLSGFLPRVVEYCKDMNIPVKWSNYTVLMDKDKPSIPGITFKPFQEKLIYKAVKKQRGVILSPTGSGKTIIAIGIVSMFPKAKVLFLCHSIAILRQTMDEFKKFGFDDIGFIGDGEWDLSGRIIIGSIQSMRRLQLEEINFDITIIDEVHHLSGKKTQYFQFMEKNFSIMRLGFT